MKLPTALTFQITVPTPTTVFSLEQAAAREANERGIALAHHGRFFEAAAALKETYESDSEYVDAYSNLGAVLRRLEMSKVPSRNLRKPSGLVRTSRRRNTISVIPTG